MYSDGFVAGLQYRIELLQSEVASKKKELADLREAFFAVSAEIKKYIGDDELKATMLGSRNVQVDIGAAFAHAIIEKELRDISLRPYDPVADENLLRVRVKYKNLRPKF
jgi:hypothetical protein